MKCSVRVRASKLKSMPDRIAEKYVNFDTFFTAKHIKKGRVKSKLIYLTHSFCFIRELTSRAWP